MLRSPNQCPARRLAANVLRIAASLVMAGVTLASTNAQQQPATADEAIARFDRDRDDPKKRWRAVEAMAGFTDQRITDRLLAEIERVRDDLRYRADLTDALGAVPRVGVIEVLEGTLFERPGSRAIRRSSAKGIARQGDAGVARLVALLGTRVDPKSIASAPDDRGHLADVRRSCIAGLGVSTSPRAAEALAGLVGSKDDDEAEQALVALDRADPSDAVDAARLACASGQRLELAAIAAGQLVRHGHPKAREIVGRLHKKLSATDRYEGDARGALVRAMVPLLDDSDMFEPFLQQASASDADVAEVVAELRDEIVAHQAFLEWVLRHGLARPSELERCLAIRLLTHADDASVTERLIALVRAKEPSIVHTAVRALGERGDRAALPALRKLLEATGSERRIEALFGVHALSKSDPGWEDELLELANTSDRSLRATVLDFLADLGSERGLERVLADLDDPSWSTRAAAYDYCRKVRAKRSIPPLIGRVDAERGRLREDVLDTLLSLTARRYPTTERWRAWWDEHGESFELVPARESDASDDGRRKPAEGRTVTYYDLPLLSERVAFVVDTSGSMRHGVGTSQEHTRLDEAKRQLGQVVEKMPAEARFNIVFFHHDVNVTFKRLTKATPDARKKAIKRVEASKPRGGTNVHDALKAAFDDEDVDTIYLLSDGYPSAGPIADADALADEVARWNRTRQVRIHCIAIGSRSRMLQRIAGESGGLYTHHR